METKKNDWFATLMFNEDKSLDDFRALNITPDNTGLKDIGAYKNIPEVQERFTNKDTGVFDEDLFTKFYNNAKIAYNEYETENFVNKVVSKYEYGSDAWFAPIDSRIQNNSPRFVIEKNPTQYSQGISYITKTGDYLNADLSARELAQREKVVDYLTGESFDWTPNEKGGLFKALDRPTLVLAKWDYDDPDGNFKKGDLKYNENGMPYYETLGDRDIYGKDVLHFTDTITEDGSKWNRFDFLDADGKEKSIGGTLVRTAAQLVPMFLPYGVGEIYGAITAASALARLAPKLGKMIDSFVTGTDDNKFGRNMSKWEGWTEANLNWNTTSDYSREHLFSVENFGNMVGAISGQLFQQKMIGAIPTILNKAGDAGKNAKVGRDLALMYMAATSAQDSYNDFKEAGASDWVAGAGMLASMLSLYGLMNQEYFRDRVFKYTFMDETGIKYPANRIAREVDEKILTASGKTVSAKETAGIINDFRNKYTKGFKTLFENNELLDRASAESLEEVMEELTTDGIKALTSVFDGLGIKVTEDNQELDFGFSGKDIASRYGMSALGGFVGGGIFHLQSKYDTFYQEKFQHRLKNDIAKDDMKRLVYYIAQGEGDTLRGFYTKWWKQGKLGSTNLTADSETLSYIDGNKQVQNVASKDGLTQNDVVYATLMNTISEIEQSVKAEGAGRWLSEDELKKIYARGFNPADKSVINAHVLVELGQYSRFNNDFYDVLTSIVATEAAIQTKIDALEKDAATDSEKKSESDTIKNNEEIKELKKKLKELKDEKDSFLKGDRNKYYAGQGLFLLNKPLSSLFSGVKDIHEYVLLRYNKNFDALTDSQKEAYKKEFDEYNSAQGSERAIKGYDLYLAFGNAWAPLLQKEAERLKNVKLDEIHSIDVEGVNYNELIKEYNSLFAESKMLQKEQNLSEEQSNRLKELEESLIELRGKLDIVDKNPGFVLQAMLNDGKYKDLNQYLLNGINDLSIINLEKQLDQMYSEVAEKNGFLSNDDQLNGLYTLLRRQFGIGDTASKVHNWGVDFISQRVPGFDFEDEASMQTVEQLMNDSKGLLRIDYDPSMLDITPEQKKIALMINDAVDSLGFDNSVFLKKLAQIKDYLKANTTIADNEIDDLLNTVLPKVGTTNLTDVLAKYDNYRSNIVYSAFVDLFKNIKYTISDEEYSLFDLLETESKNLIDSPKLSEYVINNKAIAQLLSEDRYIPLYTAIVGVITGAWDNTNKIINGFAGGELGTLVEFDETTGRILLDQASLLFNKLEFLKKLSDANNEASLKIQKQIELNMRPKFIKALVDPVFAAEFDKVFKPHAEPSDVPYLTECWRTIMPANFNWDLISEDEYTADINALFVQMEQIIGDAIRNSEIGKSKDNREIAKAIRSLVGDEKNELYKMVSTQLSNELKETIEPYDIACYLGVLFALPANSFAAHQKVCLSSEDFKIAPVYGQEYGVRFGLASLCNKGFFNALLDEFADTSHIKLDASIKESEAKADLRWYAAHPVLHNFVMVPGGAGTGKTKGVVKYLIDAIASVDGLEVVGLAPKKAQAENLAKGIELEGINVYGKSEFQKKVFGKVLENYINNDTTRMIDSSDVISEYVDDVFDKNSKVKILVIDEVTLFTKDELAAISSWAEENNVMIFAIGDVKQNSAKVEFMKDGKEKMSAFTGIEDCFYLRSPELTASLRALNEAKRKNYVYLNTILRGITKDYAKNPQWPIDTLNSKCPDSIDMIYYESEDKSILYGEKLTKSEDEIYSAIDRFKEMGTVGIVTDQVDKYTRKYSGIKNITIIPTNVAQGGEFDFVIIDKSFRDDNKIGNALSKFSTLRDLYTLSQRSTTATLILDKDLTNIIKISNSPDPLANQTFEAPNASQIEDFKNWKLSSLDKINADDDLISLIEEEASNYEPSSNVLNHPNPKPDPQPGVEHVVTDPNVTGNDQSESAATDETNSGTEFEAKPTELSDDAEPAIPPVVTIPQNNENTTIKGSVKVSPRLVKSERLHNYLLNPNLLVKDNLTSTGEFSYDSLAKLMDSLGTRLDTDDKRKDYVQYVHSLASYVLLHRQLPNQLMRNLANFIVRGGEHKPQIVSLLKAQPELWIEPYDDKSAKFVAKFKSGGNSFDVILGFVQSQAFGRYTGDIVLDKPAQLQKSSKHISLEEFKQKNPFAIISEDWGIIEMKASAVKKSTKFNDGTKTFLTGRNNMGKACIGITTSPALAEECFGAKMFTPSNGRSVSNYDKYAFAMVQKLGDIKAILQYVTAIGQQLGLSNTQINKIIQENEWFNEVDSMQKASKIAGIDLMDLPAGKKGKEQLDFRKYQIIPDSKLGILTKALLNSDIDNLLQYNLFSYLNTILKPNKRGKNKKRGESKGLVLTLGNLSFLVEAEWDNYNPTGNLIVHEWSFKDKSIVGEANIIKSPSVRSGQAFKDLCQTLFNADSAEVRFVTKVFADENHDEEIWPLSPNKTLFALTAGLKNEQIDIISEKILSSEDQFKFGLFLNMHGDETDDRFGQYSAYRPYSGVKENVYIQISDVTPEVYKIDVSKVEPINAEQSVQLSAPTVNGKPGYKTLSDYLESEPITNGPLLQLAMASAKSDSDIMLLLNNWLIANSENHTKVRQIQYDRDSKLYYTEDSAKISIEDWIKWNFSLKVLNQFGINGIESFNTLEDIDVSLNNRNFGEFSVTLSNNETQDWIIRNEGSGLEYIQTRTKDIRHKIENLISEISAKHPGALTKTLGYINSLVFSNDEKLDRHMTDFLNEINMLMTLDNESATELQAQVMEYLETKLDNNEC